MTLGNPKTGAWAEVPAGAGNSGLSQGDSGTGSRSFTKPCHFTGQIELDPPGPRSRFSISSRDCRNAGLAFTKDTLFNTNPTAPMASICGAFVATCNGSRMVTPDLMPALTPSVQRICQKIGQQAAGLRPEAKERTRPGWVLHHSASPQRQDAGEGTVIRLPPASLPRPLMASAFPSKKCRMQNSDR